MNYILSSSLKTYYKDENDIHHVIPVPDTNLILTNIKKLVKKHNSIVMIANNPELYENNDLRANILFDSFDMSGLCFQNKIVLDNRNKKNAKKIIEEADLIILSGGKIICEMQFFKSIKLKSLLKNTKALVLGISAGSMNLCKDVCNFPEELTDLNEPRQTKGLGIFNKIIIPHFDGTKKEYQLTCDEIDIVNDFLLPFSTKKEILGMPNGSYIMIKNGKVSYHGLFYKIKNKKCEYFNVLKGCIIEQGIKDNRIINQLFIRNFYISNEENKKDRLHHYTVLVTTEQIQLLANNLKSGYYFYFWDNKQNITAIFSSGKIFNFNANKKSSWKPAIKHALELGIPKENLTFLIK